MRHHRCTALKTLTDTRIQYRPSWRDPRRLQPDVRCRISPLNVSIVMKPVSNLPESRPTPLVNSIVSNLGKMETLDGCAERVRRKGTVRKIVTRGSKDFWGHFTRYERTCKTTLCAKLSPPVTDEPN